MKKEIKFQACIKPNDKGFYELFLVNRAELVAQVAKNFGREENGYLTPIELIGSIALPKKPTTKLKAYFFAEVVPRITLCLVDMGYAGLNDDITYKWLCERHLGHRDLYNEKTKETIEKFWTVSMSDLDEKEERKFVNDCIVFANTELHARIVTPEEYKQQQESFKP